jgi:hypothetical protein
MGLQGDRCTQLAGPRDECVDRVVDAGSIEPGLGDGQRLNPAAPALEVGDRRVIGQHIGGTPGAVRESSVRRSIGP